MRPDESYSAASGGRVIVDARLPWGSGIGRYVSNTVPRVAALLPQHRFELIVSPLSLPVAQSAIAGRSNLSVQVSDIEPFSLTEQLRMPGRLAGADLVWFTNYWVPLAFRGRFVAAVHDVLHQDRELFAASFLKRTLSRWTFRHVHRRSSGICYLSRFSQREFDNLFGANPKGVVCGCGIDHGASAAFDPERPPAKAPQVLLVAAPKMHKNIGIAIEAFRAAKIPDSWRLVVVAPGDRLRSSIDVSGLMADDRRIEHVEAVSDAKLHSLYSESAIVLMPSRYEGFGLPLAEGLQAGAQCISSTAEALVEIGQGAHVTFVNPVDLPGWVKAIEHECARFGAGAVPDSARSENMRHAQQFRWDEVARRTACVIEDALKDASSTNPEAKGIQ